MERKSRLDPEELFANDELDDALFAADDTGLIAEEQQITQARLEPEEEEEADE